MTGPRGFVLVNALILVAALSAVAIWLLTRAETGRVSTAAAHRAMQLELYLGAYQNLAKVVLDRDALAVDHFDEPWARTDRELDLDRGRVSGQIEDLEGRFNINWLANPEDAAARTAFAALTSQLGVSTTAATSVIEMVSFGGDRPARQPGSVAELPPGGPVLMLDQLTLPPRDMTRLRPYLTALPGNSRLNVNTASAQVLASFLPGVNPASLASLLIKRKQEPFPTVDAFLADVVGTLGSDAAKTIDTDRLAVTSNWFGVTVAAELDGQEANRRVVLRRLPLPAGAQVAYLVDAW